MMTYAQLVKDVFVRFRRKRMQRFFSTFKLTPGMRVLDIGGEPDTWMRESGQPIGFHVTQINMHPKPAPAGSPIETVEGDATALPFADNSYDLAFSNSVIEHVGGWEKQQDFAREARRVALKLWIQTPARSFPVEPHLVAPVFQFLPKSWQHKLVRWTPRALMTPGVQLSALHSTIDSVRLLTYREFKQLFPDCSILRERFLGLTKSYVAVRV
ncbi:MAG: class I SAM-dependent methyltransferase [Terracidiphilus sp.]|nr:class I SAM-dependent methyltransferase [Terracidiphilus sp.]